MSGKYQILNGLKRNDRQTLKFLIGYKGDISIRINDS